MNKEHHAEPFVKQLQKIQRRFLKEAREYGKIDEDTFDIEICNRYLILRVEGEDEYGDTFSYKREVEAYSNHIYQKELVELNSYCD